MPIKKEVKKSVGRPRKAPKVEVEKVVKKQVSKVDSYDETLCWNCGMKRTHRCFKGSRNQYRFCGIDCFNADQTPNDAD